MGWCEANGVGYLLGLARNQRLEKRIAKALRKSRRRHVQTGLAARRFRELRYRTRESWSRTRRVVAKAEYLAKGANPRFVVTNLDAKTVGAQALYEDLYCARGDMENRIKEQQLGLFADRTSTATLRANQLRLYLSSFAYVLMHGLRRLGLAGTRWAKAQCTTIRATLLKLAASVRISARKCGYPLPRSTRTRMNSLRCWPISGAGRPGRLPDRPRPPVCLTLCDADNSAAGLARPDNGAGPGTSGPYLTDYCVCPLHRPT